MRALSSTTFLPVVVVVASGGNVEGGRLSGLQRSVRRPCVWEDNRAARVEGVDAGYVVYIIVVGSSVAQVAINGFLGSRRCRCGCV
jgi:hypothetical protein